MARSFKVLGLPAWRARDANPFTYLLSQGLETAGATVRDMTRRNGFTSRADVVHIHWPQHYVVGPPLKALAKSLELLTRLAVQKVRGAKIVWTVHNVLGHEGLRRREALLMPLVIALVDGLVFLSHTSRQLALQEAPTLASKPFRVIPHGIYGDSYPPSRPRAAARARFDIGLDERVLGFVGDLRPYKGLDALVQAFSGDGGALDGITLFVAGAAADPLYASQVREDLTRLRAGGVRVVQYDKRLDDLELVDAIAASDVIALPYKASWNSGLAVLVLEKGGRLLTSPAPIFYELQEEVGEHRLTVASAWDGDAIASALATESVQPQTGSDAFARGRDWNTLGAQTLDFYSEL